jgi:hypothetical protein
MAVKRRKKPSRRRASARKPAAKKILPAPKKMEKPRLEGETEPRKVDGLGRVSVKGTSHVLETKVDKLYRTIMSRTLSVEEASRMFGVPEEKIEEWASILEEHDLIRMDYPKFGKPVLNNLRAEQAAPRPGRSMPRPGRKIVFPIAAAIMLLVVVLLPRSTVAPNFFLPAQGNQVYLIPISIVIIVIFFLIMLRRKRGKRKN